VDKASLRSFNEDLRHVRFNRIQFPAPFRTFQCVKLQHHFIQGAPTEGRPYYPLPIGEDLGTDHGVSELLSNNSFSTATS
jgi:hypothetical protein